jgi:uncharacterized protein DUF3768
MHTPYDTDDEMLAEVDKSFQVRALNDEFRTELISPVSALWHNRLVCTSGVAAHGDDFIERALRAVREFAAFNEVNGPYGEHDFGSFELDGVMLYWKIDYYDPLHDGRSLDPADPDKTKRVLTILLADEY